MEIPEKFNLMGETFVVVKNQFLPENGLLGNINYNNRTVSLAPTNGRLPYNEELTFYHELVHGILSKMKKDELKKDEDFVDMFADLLLQYENSKSGKYKK